MKRIDNSTATIDNLFTEGNPGTATPATIVSAEWLNVVQEEIAAVIEETGETLDQTGVARDQLLTAIQQLITDNLAPSVPAGTVKYHAAATAPTGYLECNGAAVSRTTYAALFAAIGDDYGPGDGTTTFNLPDLRGEFIRGWDHGRGVDPDAASRTNRGDGTTGDNVGTKQADQLKAHTHTENYAVRNGSGSLGNLATGSDLANASQNSGSTGGNETRPRNVNLLVIIKT